MKVVAFIPARFASTRLPGKPLAKINGRPMIQWVYERVSKSRLIEDVTVATDDERILRAVSAFGGKAVLTSGACGSGTERVAEASRNISADIVVNVQGDEPLLPPELIDDCVREMISDRGISISTPACRIKTAGEFKDPNIVKVVMDKNGFAMYFSRSPIPYSEGRALSAYRHIGLYVYRKDVLLQLAKLPESPLEKAERLEQLRALENGFRIKTVITPYNPVSVDTKEDLEKVRGMF